MKRRIFLQTSSSISLPMLVGGLNITAITKSNLFNLIDEESDKVLVLINLIGGNDGLNTIIPLDQYDRLANVRANIIVPENELLPVNDKLAFHPEFGDMRTLYDNAKLGIIQNVGYPNQNRSHFRSSDIWATASDADEFLTSGWLGRFFDSQYLGYPEDYPNPETPDPIAITLGYVVSETCQGQSSNFSIAINDPDNLSLLQEPVNEEVPDTCYGSELSFVRNAIRQTNAYTESISKAADLGTNLSTNYNEEDSLAGQLKVVAQLISGGLCTKVFVVSIGGFDTHANQVNEGEPSNGGHANLLTRLSSAIFAFQDDMRLQGLEDKVIGMTFSEFGRRIRSNNSLGTDHGSAAPLFVFGKCVNPGILGDNPEIPQSVGNKDGVPMQFDFRSVYGSILMDWFGATENEVINYLFEDFTYIPIIAGCSVTSTENFEALVESSIKLFPNPFENYTQLEFKTIKSHFRISLFDAMGSEIKVLVNRELNEGIHTVSIQGHDLPAGNYFVRIIGGNTQKTKIIQKIGDY